MKTFTVILSTVTFLVFALILLVITQDEPEVIPPDNLTSGITDSSAQRTTADPGTENNGFTGSHKTQSAGPVPKPVNQATSGQYRDNNIATSQSGLENNDRGSTLQERNQTPEPSFTMTNQQVDDEVRSMRRQQMEILERINK